MAETYTETQIRWFFYDNNCENSFRKSKDKTTNNYGKRFIEFLDSFNFIV